MTAPQDPLHPYDAVVLVSFGGPEAPQDVMPFLRRVTAGKNIPDERLAEVAEHYDARGGRSPINDECRALLAGLRARLDEEGSATPLAWGNRNGPPELDETLAQLRARGAHRVLALLTSAYSSYSSCRQYRENLADALTAAVAADATQGVAAGQDASGPAGSGAPADPLEVAAGMRIDKLAPYATDAAFVDPNARLAAAAWERLTRRTPGPAHLVFVTHSIPLAMNDASGPAGTSGAYVAQHEHVAALIAQRVSAEVGTEVPWTLAYCSRSGPPSQPWLEPDVNDEIRRLADAGVAGVVVAPIGFVADHMEVVHDLDDEAAGTAQEAGVAFERVPTVRDDPEFVAGLVRLMRERAALARAQDAPGRLGAGGPAQSAANAASGDGDVDVLALPPRCLPGCCANLRGDRPALCGSEPVAAPAGVTA
ncbi:ferrochelatase [Agilicoccus flavus]|uniref:ferrochelatase n=1 Tax=Agilicoccus flavus TaxID=2775968 RepID=UPI001CF71398|nr:ferrochelatase [Agilicoccus flavus]